jgi:hypothetical protein
MKTRRLCAFPPVSPGRRDAAVEENSCCNAAKLFRKAGEMVI